MNPSLYAETEALTRTLDKRQKAVSEGQYLQSTMQVVAGYGSKGPKARPFKQDLSIRWFHGLVYALAMLNAKAFAKVPIRLYVKSRPDRAKAFKTRTLTRKQRAWLLGEKHINSRHAPSLAVQRKAAEYGDVEEVVDAHPVTELLRTANEWQNGFELSILRSLQLQITGNSYLWPEMDNRVSRPVALWLVPSQYTRVMAGTQGRYIDGYQYGPPQDPRYFGPDELINWKMPGIDPMALYGYGRVQGAWDAINLRGAERMQSQAMYDNGARPDYAIIWKSGASKPDMDRVDAAIDSKFRGPNKAGSFLTVSGDVDIKPLQWSPKDIGSNEDVENEICNVFGVPLSKVRSMDPNRSNGEQADAGWLRDTILPDLRFDEEQLNARYLPLFGEVEDAFLCYDDPVPENEGETREGLIAEVGASVRTHNEARAELGLPPAAQDFIIIPSKAQALKVDEAGNIGEALYEPPQADAGGTAEDTPPPKKKVVKKLGGEAEGEHDHKWVPLLGLVFAEGIRNAFVRQRRIATATMTREASVDTSQPPKPPELTATDAALLALAVSFLTQAYNDGADRAVRDLGGKLPTMTPDGVSRVVNDMARLMVTRINQTTSERLFEAARLEWSGMTDVSSEDAVRAVGRAVKLVFDDAEENRAGLIADYETRTAMERGGEAAARLLHVKHRVYWVLGPNPCPRCERIHAAYPDGVEGGTNFRDPNTGGIVRPGEVHPRCECVSRYTRVK